jgi:hypothetical protein
MENALYFARLEMPKPKPRKASQAARHRTAIAPATGNQTSVSDVILNGTPQEAREAARNAFLAASGYSDTEDE